MHTHMQSRFPMMLCDMVGLRVNGTLQPAGVSDGVLQTRNRVKIETVRRSQSVLWRDELRRFLLEGLFHVRRVHIMQVRCLAGTQACRQQCVISVAAF